MAKPKAWRPVLNGMIYCSPACGGGCTRQAYDTAQALAKELAAQMGSGWKPAVWENLGWHYAVEKSGVPEVHASSGPRRWTAYLGEGVGGRWVESSTSPEAAIRKVRRAAEGERDAIGRLLGASYDS